MAATEKKTPEMILQEKNQKALEDQAKQIETLTKALANTRAGNQPDPRQILWNGAIRNGEDPLSSRGYSFMKCLGMLTGAIPHEQAKIEKDISNRLHKCYVDNSGPGMGYKYAPGVGMPGYQKFLAPLCTSFMQEDVVDRSFRQEMKSLVNAGTDGADHDEMQWVRRKQLQAQGYGQKDLSWLNDQLGGALVAPPQMGELIELLRNKEALVNAGARTVPLPPQGRLVFPRQTSPSLTYWIGENKQITASDINTGEVTLQAKKLAVITKMPNELIRFASPAVEALIRDDMTKSLALGLDFAGLQGTGGDSQPLGVLNFAGVQTLTSSSPGADGDALVGQDIYRFLAAVEEANAEFEGFIMRPKTMYAYYQLRWDAVAQGDASGGFLFSLIREPGEGTKPSLAGKPVTTSTQVSQSLAKGNASNLTYIVGGMWSDMLIGMFGAIEFAATNVGDTSFQFDQTWVRGILSADVQLRHEAAFVKMLNLKIGNA